MSKQDELKITKSAAEIKTRVAAMGALLTEKFKDKNPVAICVLNGSFMFYADLIRAINLDITCEFLGVSSYKNAKVSSGEVAVTLDLELPLQGQHIILIEDLVDSGLTMNYLRGLLLGRAPASLTTVALLLKPLALKAPCPLDVVGFEVPNDFIVGYGIDYAGEYRNLPYLAVVSEE